jgi:F-type H+-transporting ATPase subunit epsilon
MADSKLEVHVVTPEQEVWAGDADMVVVTAADGQLGVLPGHAPLLALLGEGPLKIKTGSSEILANVDSGFLHVANDRVEVLAEHAELQ